MIFSFLCDIIFHVNGFRTKGGLYMATPITVIKDDEFRKLLKKGISGGFFFYGDEDYMKNFTLKAAREAICPDPTFAVFNDLRIDFMDYSASALLDALIPPPMMTEQKIVTINGLSMDILRRQRELPALEEALSELSQYEYNVLIISIPADQMDPGNPDRGRPSDEFALLSKYLTPVVFDPISGARLVSWVGKHFEHEGVSASPAVCSALIEHCGRSMYVLSREIEKLAFYVLWNGRNSVTAEDVKNIAIADVSLGAYEFSNAIAEGRGEDALKALAAMKFMRMDPLLVMGEISRTLHDMILVKSMKEKGASMAEIISVLRIAKIPDFVVKKYYASSAMTLKRLYRIAELCSAADLELKGVTREPYLPIERLVCSI